MVHWKLRDLCVQVELFVGGENLCKMSGGLW
jgi:hypothetical protein